LTVWSYLLDGLFIGATRAREMRDAMLLAALLALPAGWLLQGLGNHGLWLAFCLFMLARSLAMAVMAGRLWPRLLEADRWPEARLEPGGGGRGADKVVLSARRDLGLAPSADRKALSALRGGQVGGARQAQAQGVQVAGALGGAQPGARDLVAVVAHQLVGGQVHVAQQILNGVVGLDAGVVDAAVRALVEVHRIGVAEQVVHVAENLLIGADQEDAQQV